jgi:hypothetical protein
MCFIVKMGLLFVCNNYVLFRLLYKSDLSGLGYGGLAPHVIVFALGLSDSKKNFYFVKKKKKIL